MLRYDEAVSAAWSDEGKLWQMVFLRWNPGRIAVHLAKSHTPASCLTAAGKNLVSVSNLKYFQVGPLELPFRVYVVEESGRKGYVFYCLWEDRAAQQGFAATSLTYRNRLEPVLAGRRNLGQRSLEVAVWGFEDAPLAEAALVRQLEKVIRVQG